MTQKMPALFVVVFVLIVCLSLIDTIKGEPFQTDSGRSDSMSVLMTHDSIIVTATRTSRSLNKTPLAMDVIQENKIQLQEPTISVSDAMKEVSGVIVNNRQNFAIGERIVMRGIGSRAQFGVRGIKIFVDGIPLTMADGQAQTSNIDLSTTGRIEVIRGPSSSLYGNAAGGVIHFYTQEPRQEYPFQISLRSDFGSFGMQKVGLKVSVDNPTYHYVLGANQLVTDGFRQHSASKIRHLNGMWTIHGNSKVSITLMANLYDAPYLLNPSTLDESAAQHDPTSVRPYIIEQGAAEKASQGQAGFSIRYNFENGEYVHGTIYSVQRSLVNPIPGRIIRLKRLAGGIRSLYHKPMTLFHRSAALNLGVDYESQNDEREEFENDGLRTENSEQVAPEKIFDFLNYGPKLIDQTELVYGFGPFAQLELSWSPQIEFVVGGRADLYQFTVTNDDPDLGGFDRNARFMAQFSPMIGITYSPTSALNFYTNLSTAFQTPTMSELGNRPDGTGGFNLSLQPEKIRNVEFGLRGQLSKIQLQYRMAAYSLTILDMLVPYQALPESEVVYHENAGSARNNGVELQADWQPIPEISSTLSYTFQDFRFRDYQKEYEVDGELQREQLSGKDVPGVPSHRIYWQMTYQHPSRFYAQIQAQGVSEYYANNYNGPPPGNPGTSNSAYINDAYAVLNFRLGKTFALGHHQIRLATGINNLLDERYNASVVPNAFGQRFYEPAPGRHWFATIEFVYSQRRH